MSGACIARSARRCAPWVVGAGRTPATCPASAMRIAHEMARSWCAARLGAGPRSHAPFTNGDDNSSHAPYSASLSYREETVDDPRKRLDCRARARLLGLFVAFVGAADVGSAILPGVERRMEFVRTYLTPTVTDTALGATALVGLALMLIGRGLAHRRALAYRLALALLAVSVVTHVLKGLDIEEAVISLAAFVVLIRSRRLFTVPVAPTRWRSVVTTAPMIVAGVFAYAVAGIVVRRGAVEQTLTWRNVPQEVGARLVGLSGGLQIDGR